MTHASPSDHRRATETRAGEMPAPATRDGVLQAAPAGREVGAVWRPVAMLVGLTLLAVLVSSVALSWLSASNAQAQQRPAAGAARQIDWDALVPKSWDPVAIFRELKLDQIRSDADPRAIEAMERLRKAFDEAPVESSLNGNRIKIMGYLVPLDMSATAVGEFLLVPYFGACIHTPPPPANQIIHVIPKEPMKGMRAMEAVWVEGLMETTYSRTAMGSAGYRVTQPIVTIYKRP